MEIIYQTPDDLVLGIFTGGALEPIGLTVLDSKVFSIGAFTVIFRIIGESHWISVYRDDQTVLQEILACVQLDVPCPHAYSFAKGYPYTYSIEPLHYTTAISSIETGIEPFLPPNTDFVYLEFPHPLGLSLKPYTSLTWRWDNGILRWNSVHIYPLQDKTVTILSESSIALAV